ncbi:MAG TPA: GrpB family protein [Bryobacteraceae bacterium]|jgi:GrpB-like predicted nucleotidyltransferase (UPF0157 family)
MIRIVDYDPGWPARFFREAAAVETALGARVLLLEHVGSTSVPELPAKPIIDILLVVADSAREEEYAAALERAGYEIHVREPEWYEHRMFKSPAADVHLHVFSLGCPEIDRMLTFRDWLRISKSDRELYAKAKRELAQRAWKRMQDYADAKTPVVQEILARMRNSQSR